MNEITEITSPPAAIVATQSATFSLLQTAVGRGASIDELERLMALHERAQAGLAQQAYNEAFSAFKAEAVRIIKNRGVTDGPLKGKRYAELHAVVNAVTPALSKHGLSAAWKLTKDDKDWIEVTCTLKHSGGHSESVSMGGPPDAGGAKNAIMARASTVSYLERYTLKAILGLSEQDDDDDGGMGVEELRADEIAKVWSAKSSDELGKVSRDGAARFTKAKDVEGYRHFSKAVNEARAALRGAA